MSQNTRCIGIYQQKLETIKDFYIFSLKHFFLILALPKIAKQNINNFMSLVLIIIVEKIVAEQLFDLLNLVKAKVLYIYKLT